MSDQATATPRPWTICTTGEVVSTTDTLNGFGRVIAWHAVSGHHDLSISTANAELIVRAVNSNDALVEALREAEDRIQNLVNEVRHIERPFIIGCCEFLKKIRALLAAAESK